MAEHLKCEKVKNLRVNVAGNKVIIEWDYPYETKTIGVASSLNRIWEEIAFAVYIWKEATEETGESLGIKIVDKDTRKYEEELEPGNYRVKVQTRVYEITQELDRKDNIWKITKRDLKAEKDSDVINFSIGTQRTGLEEKNWFLILLIGVILFLILTLRRR
jgi:hypothetical protein